MDQRRDLYLIFKESVNNLARHSGARQAVIAIQCENSELKMLVSDNGRGFDATLPSLNNGLKSIYERAGRHHWKIRILSSPGGGTEIHLQAKIA